MFCKLVFWTFDIVSDFGFCASDFSSKTGFSILHCAVVLIEGQNPFAKIKERKRTENEIRYVEVEEYRKLVKAAKNIWWHALFSIAYGRGLRRSEILHLTWADVDFDQQRIKVTAKKGTANILEWEPKSRRNRVVPMSDESSQLLANIQVQAPEGHPYVFVSPKRLKRIKKRRKAGD